MLPNIIFSSVVGGSEETVDLDGSGVEGYSVWLWLWWSWPPVPKIPAEFTFPLLLNWRDSIGSGSLLNTPP